MELFNNKRVCKLVVQAIQEAKSEVAFNKTWQGLHDELGIGVINNKSLFLSSDDRKTLTILVKREAGVDVTTVDFLELSTSTRTQASESVLYEKWAGRKVKEDIIYIRSLSAEVELDKRYSLPENSYLALPWQHVTCHQHNSFIVIENLDVFLVADRVNWPKSIIKEQPLLIYRGDKEANPAAVKKFIKQCENTFYVFFDYDPAGLMMALTQARIPSLIIPDLPISQLKTHSQKSTFNSQMTARSFLEKREGNSEFILQAKDILENKLAVMQERMIGKDMSLKIAV